MPKYTRERLLWLKISGSLSLRDKADIIDVRIKVVKWIDIFFVKLIYQ
jgi:hypothetical protein